MSSHIPQGPSAATRPDAVQRFVDTKQGSLAIIKADVTRSRALLITVGARIGALLPESSPAYGRLLRIATFLDGELEESLFQADVASDALLDLPNVVDESDPAWEDCQATIRCWLRAHFLYSGYLVLRVTRLDDLQAGRTPHFAVPATAEQWDEWLASEQELAHPDWLSDFDREEWLGSETREPSWRQSRVAHDSDGNHYLN
ncbi:hypothetical protein F5Y16DRAFT_368557 [Xylariaceae sp. FL0255]|nr:hypothetical protein F5Y16DRAFT_368557 [Xylariaceae sp. FL0255]